MSQEIRNMMPSISIVTPTLHRPLEVVDLLSNIKRQSLPPIEIIIVDGNPDPVSETETLVRDRITDSALSIRYIRHGGGTAIQRNVGIDAATGQFIAFIDDDVRLCPSFLEEIIKVFSDPVNADVGGVVGYRTNRHFRLEESNRWGWYRRLKLLTVFEPGKYDFRSGYPVNSDMQPPFSGTRQVDFMTTACAVWRREVFDAGLRFDKFFRDYGVLEDAHLSLRAARRWRLLQCGTAECEELHSPIGRADRGRIGYKSVVNYFFVFRDIAGPLTWGQKFRFWRFQSFEFFRIGVSALRRQNSQDLVDLRGRVKGIFHLLGGTRFFRPEN